MRVYTFEEVLARDGQLVYRTRGASMLPMLRQGRDLVIIEPPDGRLRPFDVALYRRGPKYVLHRVIRVRERDYAIRGDNTYRMEYGITDANVLGVLKEFVRKGKRHRVTDRSYVLYVRAWCALYPVRFFVHHVVHRLKRGIRRLRRACRPDADQSRGQT